MPAISMFISDVQVAHLSRAVEAANGETPRFFGYRSPRNTGTPAVLGYIGNSAGVVVFELAVILAHEVLLASRENGYEYGACDAIEELRNVFVQIGMAQTDVQGRELVFYWPTVIFPGAD